MHADDWVQRLVRGRQGASREQGATSQRIELIDALARVVARDGYANTSVDSVVAQAGVSSEIFYQQFQDLESCFLAAYDLGVEVMSTTIQDGIGPPDKPPLERLDRMLVTYLETMAAEPQFARTFLIEVYAAGPRALRRRLEVWQRFSILLGEILGPEEKGGLDPWMCEALVGTVSSIVTTRVAAGEFGRLPELREPIMRVARCLLADTEVEAHARPSAAES
jgi:AcrR family transcriptional regulator